ncbi:MAG: hypothetical protein Ct9H300mP18_01570 [Candidatus Neomarinimicrobiota bacterium]|nr:MAG: hypothetical protein Ct9H300mP18_01570 [Candidatus Neomarinimicrobiota bacterium]
MPRKKIALIGGGQVGGNIALLVAQKELGDIAIIDIPEAENFVKGKALDISQLLPHDGFDCKLSGSSDFKTIKNSDVVVITAGFPRQPGMNREDLLNKKLSIMTNVANEVKTHAPDAFVIVVSNPLDAMVIHFIKFQDLKRKKLLVWQEHLIVQDLGLLSQKKQIFLLKTLLVWFLVDMETLWYQ